MERYTLDPFLISMDRFYDLSSSKRLLPGRIGLKEQMKERFRMLKDSGITNLGELQRTLKSTQKVRVISNNTGIPEDYLLLLKREAGSYLARPFPLSEFPGIPFEYTEALRSKDIRNTRDFFELTQTDDHRSELAGRTGIPEARLKEIFTLCMLSRITGVGGVFARIIYEAGIRSIEAFVKTEPPLHIEKYRAVVKKHAYAAGKLTEEDMHYCIQYASVILECSHKNDSQ